MAATIRMIVDEAEKYMGEVAGPGVQAFSEDQIFDAVVRGFDRLFKRRAWEGYAKWFQLTLDGTTGVITTDSLERVRDFEDFIAVFRDGERTEMPRMPTRLNPYTLTTGTRPLYWTSLQVSHADYAKRKLQFYPITATGMVNVYAKEYPLEAFMESWDWEDIMYLDQQLLMYAGAYEALAGDDLNAQAASIAQAAMEDRFKTIMGALADQPIPIRGGADIPRDWFVRP